MADAMKARQHSGEIVTAAPGSRLKVTDSAMRLLHEPYFQGTFIGLRTVLGTGLDELGAFRFQNRGSSSYVGLFRSAVACVSHWPSVCER
jgi:hypothetical protein